MSVGIEIGSPVFKIVFESFVRDIRTDGRINGWTAAILDWWRHKNQRETVLIHDIFHLNCCETVATFCCTDQRLVGFCLVIRRLHTQDSFLSFALDVARPVEERVLITVVEVRILPVLGFLCSTLCQHSTTQREMTCTANLGPRPLQGVATSNV